ncbi:MAG: tellurite resistance TerB family protein [Polyangiaceae bacterium]
MPDDARIHLLARVARVARGAASGVSGPAPDSVKPLSILSLAATAYGSRPSEDATVPTGFDPLAVVLFEAIVEGAFLVANSDGVFDPEERRTFEAVVVAACGGAVSSPQITALVSDLTDQLEEDGIDRRIEVMTSIVSRPDHAQEVLRIAGLVALSSEDVSAIERQTLEKLATRWSLGEGAVDSALSDVRDAIAAAAKA